MGWTRTTEWWRTLRQVCDELERRDDGQLPWQPRYADVFGDREGLLRALRYRWTLIAQAQGAETTWSVGERVLHDAALAEKHRAMLRVIDAERAVAVA
jgi:hypothetical protein